MLRKISILIIIFFMLSLTTINVTAAVISDDVQIDPGEDESELLTFTESGDNIEFSISSDIPVNVYIISSGDYYEGSSDNDFSKAKYSVLGTTSTKFTYTIPTEESYYLVIHNPNDTTATVSYEYTDVLREKAEEVLTFLGISFVICAIFIIVIIVVIVLIIYFLTRSKGPTYPPYPPYPPYPQQPNQPYPAYPAYPQPGQQPPESPPEKKRMKKYK